MIYGVGTDISKVSRFERWVRNPGMIFRFFNPCELSEIHRNGNSEKEMTGTQLQKVCEHYAARFSAKEAFVKALGTGFSGVEPGDFGIKNNADGKPEFFFGEKIKKLIDSRCGTKWNVHVSISHEKEYAAAFAVIEVGE